MESSAELVIAERLRQIFEEGFNQSHDDENNKGDELVAAAVCYAMPPDARKMFYGYWWPWSPNWWKPTPENRLRELTKAGALILAAMDKERRRAGLKEVPVLNATHEQMLLKELHGMPEEFQRAVFAAVPGVISATEAHSAVEVYLKERIAAGAAMPGDGPQLAGKSQSVEQDPQPKPRPLHLPQVTRFGFDSRSKSLFMYRLLGGGWGSAIFRWIFRVKSPDKAIYCSIVNYKKLYSWIGFELETSNGDVIPVRIDLQSALALADRVKEDLTIKGYWIDDAKKAEEEQRAVDRVATKARLDSQGGAG